MGDAAWSPAAFEERYRRAVDPWSFATSDYELSRYAAIEAALLPEPHRYRSGYEPGCSIGVLTDRLSRRCDAYTATDVSPTAVARANERCGERPGLTIEVGALQDGPGTYGPPDLIVLSEVGYYLDRAELQAVTDRLAAAAARNADLVACHWTGHSADHRLHGTEVHDLLRSLLGRHADVTVSDTHEGFLLDAWRFR